MIRKFLNWLFKEKKVKIQRCCQCSNVIYGKGFETYKGVKCRVCWHEQFSMWG